MRHKPTKYLCKYLKGRDRLEDFASIGGYEDGEQVNKTLGCGLDSTGSGRGPLST
jgi:hypothetical protein